MSSRPNSFRPSPGLILLIVGVVVLFGGSQLVRYWLSHEDGDEAEVVTAVSCERVVGLAPSIVEAVYQLGLEDRLVGVSRFCAYPPEASELPVVGGYVDLDFEEILHLGADCVILLEDQKEIAERLKGLGVHTIAVEHTSTRGIMESIERIGREFGCEDRAEVILEGIRTRLEKVLADTPDFESKPRVLICIDRDTSAESINRIVAAGREGVHQEYIVMAGGENAYEGRTPYPVISREKLIHLNPDIIIDLINEDAWETHGEGKLIGQWSAYQELDAVKNGRVFIIHEHKHMIPGPRFVDTVEVMGELFRSQTDLQND